MKLFNTPKKEDVEFFGHAVAWIFANMGKIATLAIILVVIFYVMVFFMLSELVATVKEEGLKSIVSNIWNGA